MTSIVAICNMALSNIGKDNIQALTDAGAEARACRQFYDHVRDTLIAAHPWRFAGKTVSLGQIDNDKLGAWGYAYTRPVDCLKVRWIRRAYSVEDPRPQTLAEEIANPYEIEADRIYCNLSPAFLRYTFRIVDPARFPPLFVEALAWHLATRLAMPLTRNLKIRAEAYQLAGQTLSTAAEADANEVRQTSDHDSELVAVRS